MTVRARWSAGLLLVAVPACSIGGFFPGDDDYSDSPCPSGTATFVLRAETPDDYCIGAPGACTNQWLTITRPDGTELAIDRPCAPDCSGSCEPVGCPALCALPTTMRADGERRQWDGTYWASNRCGANVSCVTSSCAPAGRYRAKMCAHAVLPRTTPIPACSPSPAPTCEIVSFDWPPADGTPIEVVLGAPIAPSAQ